MPGVFFVFKSLISSLISFIVIGFNGSTDRSGDRGIEVFVRQ